MNTIKKEQKKLLQQKERAWESRSRGRKLTMFLSPDAEAVKSCVEGMHLVKNETMKKFIETYYQQAPVFFRRYIRFCAIAEVDGPEVTLNHCFDMVKQFSGEFPKEDQEFLVELLQVNYPAVFAKLQS